MSYFKMIDSLNLTAMGQQGVKKGYNPVRRGRKSHHPLIAFVGDIKPVANLWLRSGDTASPEDFLAFPEDTSAKLKGEIVSLIRLDSGFCSSAVMDCPEENRMGYMISARFYGPVQQLLASNLCRLPLDESMEVTQTRYQIRLAAVSPDGGCLPAYERPSQSYGKTTETFLRQLGCLKRVSLFIIIHVAMRRFSGNNQLFLEVFLKKRKTDTFETAQKDCVKNSIIFSIHLIINLFIIIYRKKSVEKRPKTVWFSKKSQS
jgi:hypothetical protein